MGRDHIVLIEENTFLIGCKQKGDLREVGKEAMLRVGKS
jgi:hypothetical protein